MMAARQIAFGKAAGVKPDEPPAYWGLCFTAEQTGSVVAMTTLGSAPAVTLETSRDGEIWEPFYVGETSITLNRGERIYFKAGEGGNTAFGTSTNDYNRFSLTTGKISASGDIMSLLNGEATSDTIPANFCYSGLFQNCTALVSAPELPATTLKSFCYSGMFIGCTSLVSAPELPATTLVLPCYAFMFNGCTKLNKIEVAFSGWGGVMSTGNWVSGVPSTGTFYCPTALGTNETITRGISACPEGWTVINTD